MLKKKILAGVFLGSVMLVSSNSALALNEMMHHYRGIRSMGMGGLLFTTGTYEEALFNNPAMMTQGDEWKAKILDLTGEVNHHFLSDKSKLSEIRNADSGTQTLVKIGDSGIIGRNEHIRFSNVSGYFNPHMFTENTAFGVALLASSQNNIFLRNNTDVSFQLLTEVGPAANVAHTFLDGDLSLGLNVRFLYRVAGNRTIRASDFLTGTRIRAEDIAGDGGGIDADLGAYYKIPVNTPVKFSIGMAFNDMFGSKYPLFSDIWKKSNKAPTANVRNYNVGAKMMLPNAFVFENTMFAFEFQQIGKTEPNVYASNLMRLHMGVETYVLKWLSLRTGFNQGYIGGGIGADLPFVKLDVATYGEELGSNTGMMQDRRLVGRLAFEI